MDFNEFGVKHPHECDCGEDTLRNAVTSCMIANLMLSDEFRKLKMELEELKNGSEDPREINVKIHKDYIDVIKPDDMTDEELVGIFGEIIVQFAEEE